MRRTAVLGLALAGFAASLVTTPEAWAAGPELPSGDAAHPPVAEIRASRKYQSTWLDETTRKVVVCTVPDGGGVNVAVAAWADRAVADELTPVDVADPPGFDTDGSKHRCDNDVVPFDKGSKFVVTEKDVTAYVTSTRQPLPLNPSQNWNPLFAWGNAEFDNRVDNIPLTAGSRDQAVIAALRADDTLRVADLDVLEAGARPFRSTALIAGRTYADVAVSPDGRRVALLSIDDTEDYLTAEKAYVDIYRFSAGAVSIERSSTVSLVNFVNPARGSLPTNVPVWLLVDNDGTALLGDDETVAQLSVAGIVTVFPVNFRFHMQDRTSLNKPRLLTDRRITFGSTARHSPSDPNSSVFEAYVFDLDARTFRRVDSDQAANYGFGAASDGSAFSFRDRFSGDIAAKLVDLGAYGLTLQLANQEQPFRRSVDINFGVRNPLKRPVPISQISIDLGAAGSRVCSAGAGIQPAAVIGCTATVTSPQAASVRPTVTVTQWGVPVAVPLSGTVQFYDGPTPPVGLRVGPDANGVWRVSWTAPRWRDPLEHKYRVQLFYDTDRFQNGVPAGPTPRDAQEFFDEGRLSTPASPFALLGQLPPRDYEVEVQAQNSLGTVTSGRLRFTVPVSPGYWTVKADGVINGFGAASDTFAPIVGARPVAAATTPEGDGLWILDEAGVVHVRGGARNFGNVPPAVLVPGERPSAISTTADGSGYWIFTDRGRALSYGSARDQGDLWRTKDSSGNPVALVLNGPIISSAALPDGSGYYMVASDGGIFAFGNARFQGSMGGRPLNKPVVGLAPDPDGAGYWLIASDGGIFAFEADFRGSMPGVLAQGVSLNRPVIGAVPYGDGYAMIASDGGVFVFAQVAFLGSDIDLITPVVALAAFGTGNHAPRR
jgi:hypothetical protein